jgi:hypothetical protein
MMRADDEREQREAAIRREATTAQVVTRRFFPNRDYRRAETWVAATRARPVFLRPQRRGHAPRTAVRRTTRRAHARAPGRRAADPDLTSRRSAA